MLRNCVFEKLHLRIALRCPALILFVMQQEETVKTTKTCRSDLWESSKETQRWELGLQAGVDGTLCSR